MGLQGQSTADVLREWLAEDITFVATWCELLEEFEPECALPLRNWEAEAIDMWKRGDVLAAQKHLLAHMKEEGQDDAG